MFALSPVSTRGGDSQPTSDTPPDGDFAALLGSALGGDQATPVSDQTQAPTAQAPPVVTLDGMLAGAFGSSLSAAVREAIEGAVTANVVTGDAGNGAAVPGDQSGSSNAAASSGAAESSGSATVPAVTDAGDSVSGQGAGQGKGGAPSAGEAVSSLSAEGDPTPAALAGRPADAAAGGQERAAQARAGGGAGSVQESSATRLSRPAAGADGTVPTSDGGQPVPGMQRIDGSERSAEVSAAASGRESSANLRAATDMAGDARVTVADARSEAGAVDAARGQQMRPEPSTLLNRIVRIAEQLEQAPPPRQMTVEFGEVRLSVSLRSDNSVRVAMVGDQSATLDAEWQQDLADALADRGLDFDRSDSGASSDDDASDGAPHDGAPMPSASTPTTDDDLRL